MIVPKPTWVHITTINCLVEPQTCHSYMPSHTTTLSHTQKHTDTCNHQPQSPLTPANLTKSCDWLYTFLFSYKCLYSETFSKRSVTHSPYSMSVFGNVKCHLLLSYISLHGLFPKKIMNEIRTIGVAWYDGNIWNIKRVQSILSMYLDPKLPFCFYNHRNIS